MAEIAIGDQLRGEKQANTETQKAPVTPNTTPTPTATGPAGPEVLTGSTPPTGPRGTVVEHTDIVERPPSVQENAPKTPEEQQAAFEGRQQPDQAAQEEKAAPERSEQDILRQEGLEARGVAPRQAPQELVDTVTNTLARRYARGGLFQPDMIESVGEQVATNIHNSAPPGYEAYLTGATIQAHLNHVAEQRDLQFQQHKAFLTGYAAEHGMRAPTDDEVKESLARSTEGEQKLQDFLANPIVSGASKTIMGGLDVVGKAFDAAAGLAITGTQKYAEWSSAGASGRGAEEAAATGMVQEQTKELPPVAQQLANVFLYPFAASKVASFAREDTGKQVQLGPVSISAVDALEFILPAEKVLGAAKGVVGLAKGARESGKIAGIGTVASEAARSDVARDLTASMGREAAAEDFLKGVQKTVAELQSGKSAGSGNPFLGDLIRSRAEEVAAKAGKVTAEQAAHTDLLAQSVAEAEARRAVEEAAAKAERTAPKPGEAMRTGQTVGEERAAGTRFGEFLGGAKRFAGESVGGGPEPFEKAGVKYGTPDEVAAAKAAVEKAVTPEAKAVAEAALKDAREAAQSARKMESPAFGGATFGDVTREIQKIPGWEGKGVSHLGQALKDAVRTGNYDALKGVPDELIDRFTLGSAQRSAKAAGLDIPTTIEEAIQHLPDALTSAKLAERETLTAKAAEAEARAAKMAEDFRAGGPETAKADAEFEAALGKNAPKTEGAGPRPPFKPPTATAGGGGGELPKAAQEYVDIVQSRVDHAANSVGRDWGKTAENILTLPKSTTVALSPLHAAGRHIMSLLIAHPISYAKGVGGGAKTFADFVRNPKDAEEAVAAVNYKMRQILDRDGYGRTEIRSHGGGATTGEDFIPSEWPGKTPLIGRLFKGSQAAFSQVQNIARFNAVRGSGTQMEWLLRRKLTQVEKDGIADKINHFTARGFRTESAEAATARAKSAAGEELTMEEKISITKSNEQYKVARTVGRFANVPFFSPQLQSSYARMIGDLGQAVVRTAKTRSLNPADIETFRLAIGTVGAVAGWAALAQMAGLKMETDMTSGNFLKIDLGSRNEAKGVVEALGGQLGVGVMTESNGHVWLDSTHGAGSYIKTVAQTIQSFRQQKFFNARGDVIVGDPLGTQVGNRLSPGFYELNKFRLGHPADLLSILAPMWILGGFESAGWNQPTAQLPKRPGSPWFTGGRWAPGVTPVGKQESVSTGRGLGD